MLGHPGSVAMVLFFVRQALGNRDETKKQDQNIIDHLGILDLNTYNYDLTKWR